MARERIDNLTEAKRLAREHRLEQIGVVMPNVKVGDRPTHGVTGTGMDGIEVDFDELRQAERDLAALHYELVEHMNKATELGGPLGDGTSPVTGPMRRAFFERADLEGGVQAALSDYINELLGVRWAILATLEAYDAADEESLALFDEQVATLPGVSV
jgi:hypothetical protein